MLTCEKCNKEIEDDEFIVNWGWCNQCFDEDYEWYCESVAGPYDWVYV